MIEEIKLLKVELSLKQPFQTRFGALEKRETLIVKAMGQGIAGWGEAPALPFPEYHHETVDSAFQSLMTVLIPRFFNKNLLQPNLFRSCFYDQTDNLVAQTGLETAFWDWTAKREKAPLYRKLGGMRRDVKAGVVIGFMDNVADLVDATGQLVGEGYRRVKIKIKPGHDMEPVQELTQNFPELELYLDANGSYRSDQLSDLEALAEKPIAMLEQPFAREAWEEHIALQASIDVPISLDESIEKITDIQKASRTKACRAVAIKLSRAGGHGTSQMMHNTARQGNLGAWVGSMIESGIGRAHCLALATLPNFTSTGDLYPPSRHFKEDVLSNPIVLEADGRIHIPDLPGIGYEVDEEKLTAMASKHITCSR